MESAQTVNTLVQKLFTAGLLNNYHTVTMYDQDGEIIDNINLEADMLLLQDYKVYRVKDYSGAFGTLKVQIIYHTEDHYYKKEAQIEYEKLIELADEVMSDMEDQKYDPELHNNVIAVTNRLMTNYKEYSKV